MAISIDRYEASIQLGFRKKMIKLNCIIIIISIFYYSNIQFDFGICYTHEVIASFEFEIYRRTEHTQQYLQGKIDFR